MKKKIKMKDETKKTVEIRGSGCQKCLWVVKQYASSCAVNKTYRALSDLNFISTRHHQSMRTPDSPKHNVE
jgi:hypothetical protein